MAKKEDKRILDVIPLTKIPLTTSQSFSYLFNREVPIGSLVSIPLFKRKVEGVVIGNRKDFERLGNITLKNIEKVLEENFLTEEQLKLAEFISRYYVSPLGVVAKNFVPKRVKSRKYKVESLPAGKAGIKLNKKVQPVKLTPEQNNAVNKIIDSYSKFLLYGPSGSGKTEVYIHAIAKLKTQNAKLQFLILVPEKTLTSQALERYGQYFKPQEIALLSSNISKGQFYSNWQKIKSGEAKIIIGTRMAIFAPFAKLGLIVVDEEQDMSYKNWDMNPRYDARTVAEELAKIHKAKIVRGTSTPSVESYWRAKNNELKLLKLPILCVSRFRPACPVGRFRASQIEIVDMKKERWIRNYSCISKKLKAEIAYALKNKQQIVLFINRQGMSAFSICDSCKAVLRCSKCERALILGEEGYFHCLHCAYKSGVIPKCEKCSGISFKNVGLGTQKVKKEVSDLFPSARILVADSSLSRKNNFFQDLYKNFSEGAADILIGTQMISKGWDLPSVALVGIIDTDNMLSIPDFGAREKTFQLILQSIGRAGRPGAKFPAVSVVQTYQPELDIFKFIAEKDVEGFLRDETKERKTFSFPPFGKIIKLVFQDYDAPKAEAETERVYKLLKNIPAIKASEPGDSFTPNARGRYRRQIIIKYKKSISERLGSELKKLGAGWIIDVDPISII